MPSTVLGSGDSPSMTYGRREEARGVRGLQHHKCGIAVLEVGLQEGAHCL